VRYTGGPLLTPERARYEVMEATLARIADQGCESDTRGFCDYPPRTVDCPYTADRICDPCQARLALGRPRP
jgi:hypothetical protein